MWRKGGLTYIRREPPPHYPYFTGNYIQKGGGVLDWFKRGWTGLSKAFRTNVQPSIHSILNSQAAKNIGDKAKDIAKETIKEVGNNALEGKIPIKRVLKDGISSASKKLKNTVVSEAQKQLQPMPEDKVKKKIKTINKKASSKRKFPFKQKGGKSVKTPSKKSRKAEIVESELIPSKTLKTPKNKKLKRPPII